MGLLEFMAVILFGYLIGFKPSDLKNMLVLCLMGVFGIGVVAFMAAKSFLLSPNGPYAIAAILFVCFATWKLGVDQQEPELTPLDRRPNVARKAAG